MSSLRRILSSQANGAKSRRPVTPEGKSISARNALSHGITARNLAVCTESPPEFQRLLDAFVTKFRPRDEIESGYIFQMAHAQWKISRIAYLEAAHIDMEIERQEEEVDRQFEQIDDASRTALAFIGLEQRTGAISLYSNYGVRERNNMRRALRELAEARRLEDLSGPPDPSDLAPSAQPPAEVPPPGAAPPAPADAAEETPTAALEAS